jgi:hypothetical protein
MDIRLMLSPKRKNRDCLLELCSEENIDKSTVEKTA